MPYARRLHKRLNPVDRLVERWKTDDVRKGLGPSTDAA
jgi:hypothetical protein